jgi:biotin carboxyl carrier protein
VDLIKHSGDGARARYTVRLDGGPEIEVDMARPEAGLYNLLIGGRSVEAGIVEVEGGVEVDIVGIAHEALVVDPRRRPVRTAGADGAATVKSQMPGRVMRILVSPGQSVQKGDALLVIEAMKMENEVKAPRAGTVQKVAVAPGELVEARALLIELGG